MQQGSLKACRSSHYELLIHPCDLRKDDVVAEIQSLIHDARPAGVILAAPLSNLSAIVRAIDSSGTPFVRLSPGDDEGLSLAVSTNDREACAEMTRHLASLGHRKIGFIKGDPTHKAVANRFLGYQDGLRDSGLEFSSRLVAVGSNLFESGERGAASLLEQKDPPTAIFAANDDMAAGVIRYADRMRIAVPKELSVAGFDDVALAQQVYPTLTTIRQPLAAMAELAADALIGANGSLSDTDLDQIVDATMILRESTGPAPT
jgi:LacI family transcriptional regulator